MSENKTEVFKIQELVKHPNADNLSIVKFYNYECIVRTVDFNVGDLAVYIPPDSLVPLDRPEFKFLEKKGPRIRSQKLRGVQSTGLVIKAPNNVKEGDDLTEFYGIQHYNPPEPNVQESMPRGNKIQRLFKKYSHRFLGGRLKPPKLEGPYYDIENWQRYGKIFKEGETVEITEKIHGMNARYTFQQGKFHCCSRRFWRRKTKDCPYWNILNNNKWLQRLLKRNPNYIVYGEIYGNGIQKEINYNTSPVFKIFDIYDPERNYWLCLDEIYELVDHSLFNLFWYEELTNWLFGPKSKKLLAYHLVVPCLYYGPYNEEIVRNLISGRSEVAKLKDIREGIVIKAFPNRNEDHFGRAILKAVNPEYLER